MTDQAERRQGFELLQIKVKGEGMRLLQSSSQFVSQSNELFFGINISQEGMAQEQEHQWGLNLQKIHSLQPYPQLDSLFPIPFLTSQVQKGTEMGNWSKESTDGLDDTKNKKKTKRSSQLYNPSKNETKNVSKNYYKAILGFIINNPQIVHHIVQKIASPASSKQLYEYARQMKKSKLNHQLSNLRDLWIQQPYARQMRTITQYFLRKRSYNWIFNSRVQNCSVMLKYRAKIVQGVANPQNFKRMQ